MAAEAGVDDDPLMAGDAREPTPRLVVRRDLTSCRSGHRPGSALDNVTGTLRAGRVDGPVAVVADLHAVVLGALLGVTQLVCLRVGVQQVQHVPHEEYEVRLLHVRRRVPDRDELGVLLLAQLRVEPLIRT